MMTHVIWTRSPYNTSPSQPASGRGGERKVLKAEDSLSTPEERLSKALNTYLSFFFSPSIAALLTTVAVKFLQD